eukprot:2194837-Pleurochrysis_carterae.AAC.1
MKGSSFAHFLSRLTLWRVNLRKRRTRGGMEDDAESTGAVRDSIFLAASADQSSMHRQLVCDGRNRQQEGSHAPQARRLSKSPSGLSVWNANARDRACCLC